MTTDQPYPHDLPAVYDEIRPIALALPETVEKPFGGHYAPAYRVRDKLFVMTHQEGRAAMIVKSTLDVQEALLESEPERFFRPSHVGHRGWVGAYLDVEQDWDELAELIEESWRLIAPKTLVRQFDASRGALPIEDTRTREAGDC